MYPSYTIPSSEPYGQVNPPAITQRRVADAAAAASTTTNATPSYMAAAQHPTYNTTTSATATGYVSDASSTASFPPPYSGIIDPSLFHSSGKTISKQSLNDNKKKCEAYPHNTIVALFFVPSMWCVLQGFESSTPLISFLCVCLALYALDLAQLRQAFLFGSWISVVILTVTCGWFVLIEDDDENGGGGAIVLFYLVQIAVNALLFSCGACWTTLQVEWLSPSTVTSIEQTLHAILPLVASSICTFRLGTILEAEFGRDVSGIWGPYVFAFLLAVSMLTLGCAAPRRGFLSPSSTSKNGVASNIMSPTPINGDKKDKAPSTGDSRSSLSYIISPSIAFGHIALLLVGPLAMHLATCLGRILSYYASTDDLCDILLVATVPYLLQYTITWLHETSWRPSPYATPRLGHSGSLSGILRPTVVGIVASLAAQQRYLINFSHDFSYQFVGVKSPAWLISIYLTGATFSLIFTMSVWGRVSTATNEPLFGEYHDDIVQVALSLTGMLLGKGVGLPWNFTPLPVLAFLGLSLWLTTRMLRYLSIFLFVVHATGVVVFTYRFAGIEEPVSLPVWNIQLSLIRFALVVVSSSILIGLVTGISVRSAGGYGNTWIKRFDLGGVVFILYELLLMALEISLLKRPVPATELVGVMSDEAESDDMLYDHFWALLTSGLCAGLAIFMHRVKIISGKSFGIVLSLALGKAISIYIDSVTSLTTNNKNKQQFLGGSLFWRSIVASILCVVMCYPRFVLNPVYVKTAARYRRSLANGNGNTQLPTGSNYISILYVFVILPMTLLFSVPSVLIPLVNAIKSDFQGPAFYSLHPPASEVIGFALTLWGTASLFMLNYYLPDGGGELWKKLAALGFLSGIGIFCAAPTLGFSGDVMSNPYASLSSVGIQVLNRGKSRTGGWGLVAAGLATLLALTGPLELKERRTDSVRRDKLLLFRSMIFSIMFGGGVAWFIIMQSMSDAPWLVLLLTGLSCLAISFLGTISAVLGYFIELEDMEEVEQVFIIWLIAVPIFLPVTGLPQFLQVESSHPFGVGGWLSTYLVICSAAALAFAISLRSRSSKNSLTRGIANLSVVLSWAFSVAVLYGRYGVAGLDVNYDVTTVFGIPASIFGTLVLSLILLALEGETSAKDRSRTKRVSSQPQRRTTPSVGLVLDDLTTSNQWVPLVAGTASVFILASLYAILLRGAGFLSLFGANNVARSHEDVFTNVFGDRKDEHDLATLADKAISHVKALATSAKLAGAGFWTAQGVLGPLLHLVGAFAVLPSLWFLVSRGWEKKSHKLSPLVLLCLPLNAVPLVLTRGVPTLQAVAVMGLIGGSIQVMADRRAAHASKMRI
ncbi:hypothetical protein ACA910_022363 [Epithemia clementina (nom. ined.)]